MASPATITTAFFFFLLPLLTISLSPTPSDLIQKTCNATSLYTFCINSLASDPNGPSARDPKALSTLALTLALANATDTAIYAASLLAHAPSDPLVRTCAADYDRSRQALSAALDSLAAEDYDYASVNAAAAREYPAACRRVFGRSPGKKGYPPELARREDALERLCTVATEIISLLQE